MKRIVFTLGILTSMFAQAQMTKDTTKNTNTKDLETVTIIKKSFKKVADRFVYDVAASPAVKGKSVFEILKEAPLVSSTDDKTLMVVGKNNVIIYLNGRKSNMNSEAMTQFLKNTPAENIQKIEVITTPGSEYQVEGSDAIINIVLKKKSTNGLNGNLRLTNEQRKYNTSSASVSLNYRKDKLGINASLSGNEGKEAQKYILENGNTASQTTTTGMVTDPNKSLGGYLNIDYQLNDKSNLALSWNTWNNRSYDSKVNFFNHVAYLDNQGGWQNAYSRSKNSDNSRSYNNSFNLNYEVKIDSLGSKLNLNAAYLNYRKFQISENASLLSDAFGTEGSVSQVIYQDLPQKIDNFSGMVDYVKKFNNDFTFSIGGNYNQTKTDSDSKTENVSLIPPASTVYNPNHFVYNEKIYGLYLTTERKFSERFSGKAGLRYEMTRSVGTSDHAPKPEMAEVIQNYNNFLPYVSLNYDFNNDHSLSYAFSSRMRRPSFWELNPIRNYLTENNYTQNNPFVKAASTYNQELTYMFKNSYFLVLNHSFVKNAITQVPLQRTVDVPRIDANNQPVMDENGNQIIDKIQQLRYIRTNFGNKQSMSAMLGMQKSFFKNYLTTNLNIGIQHNRNQGSLSIDPTSGDVFPEYVNHKNSTSFLVKTNNTIRLDQEKTWFAGVNFFYVGKQQIELGTLKPLGSLDLSLKKIWNNWTFSVEVKDILKTYIVKIEDVQDNGNYNRVDNEIFIRGVQVGINYNFGNQKIKKIRNIDNAAGDIKSRVQ